jgi:putative peptide zinc metalloprotease protein
MVWVTDDEPVLNTNEAYAFASCADCVTVAVAFQVVLIVGSTDVVIPQNLSAAVNYECFECITAAVASQLVVTLDSAPDAEEQVALAEIWEEILAFADSIPTLPLADVIAQLEDYKREILEILGEAPMTSPTPSGSTTASAAPTPHAQATDEPTDADASPTASPAAATPPPTATPQATPAATPTPTSEPTPEPSPTPTPS